MRVTIRVEHEGRKPKDDLGVEERITTDQIDAANCDLVCEIVANLRRMIQQALEEKKLNV